LKQTGKRILCVGMSLWKRTGGNYWDKDGGRVDILINGM
jgi:hypothetical protein